MTSRRGPALGAELPLVAVSVAVVVGFIRVYDGWSFLGQLLGFALGAHLVAIVSRRLRVPVGLVLVLAVGGAALAASWILFPGTTVLGLPTHATWTAATESLHIARERYPVVLAPTEPLVGFQLAAGLALWLAAWFGDWTAHRLHAIAEALAATTAIFVFCAILGSGRAQVACAAIFAAAVLGFVAAQRSAAIDRDQSWLPTHQTTARALLRSGAAVAAVAVLAGVVVGPRLPGAGSEAALTWRNKKGADGSRVTISPMVELRKRLVDQTDRELFTVRSTERSYWRLTSLDDFDGEIWSSSGEFKEAGESLPSEAPSGREGRTITQEIDVEALAAIWAPSAFEAVSVRKTDTPLRWDPDSSTLIVDSSERDSDGMHYTVQSLLPEFDPDVLAAAGGRDPSAITDRYLGLPSDFPFVASDTARRVTRSTTTRFEKARALQDWFRREFDYSLDSPAGHGDDALVDFLESRVGYCEQFAGAFAAMARSLGIPARVAVGFTPGNRDPDDAGLYRVKGRHAHAWPEVYFPGSGWVPFEPTPGRGIPGAEPYTGVREQQDDAVPIETVTTTVTTTTPTPVTRPGQTTVARNDRPERTETAPAPAVDVDDDGFRPVPVVVGVGLIGGAVAAVLALRRRRRAAHRRAALGLADQEWERVVHHLAKRRSLVQGDAETHEEFASRAQPEVATAGPALRELAALVSEARWSPTGLDDAGDARVHELAGQVIEALDAKELVPS